jgi:hypothetical protein
LIIFIAFIGALGVISFKSYTEGNLDIIIMAPIDHQDKFCGISEGLENYPKLYFADISATTP